jgi:hypothetical protein
MTADRFAPARAVADAVLYEGYVLYPYRASARKNQLRWQFGVLVPPAHAARDQFERALMRTQVIVDPGADATLLVRVRCLQVQRRYLEAAAGERFVPTEALEVDGVVWVPWDEAVEQEIDLEPVALLPAAQAHRELAVHFTAGTDEEVLRVTSGEVVGRAIRRREAVDGLVRVHTRWAEDRGALLQVTVTVENTSRWDGPAARDDVMRHSLVAVHTLLALDDGEFISLLDPPESARPAASTCANDGAFPVLIGPEDAHDRMLASPIILYDHPAVAAESGGDFCDATEIDEILALRVLTLTDEEKAEARGTDQRAAAIIDRCDDMPPEVWARLHGAVRSLEPVVAAPETLPWWDPGVDAEVDPWTDTTLIGGVAVGKGTHVRLRPSRRADAHDLFLADRVATVAGIFRDVDGSEHVAVTIDDDPATEVLEWQRRYLYFYPDEVEVLDEAEP